MFTRIQLVASVLGAALGVCMLAPASFAQGLETALVEQTRVAKSETLLERWHTRTYLDVWRQQLAEAITLPPGMDKECEERLRNDWKSAVLASYDPNAMFVEMGQALAAKMSLADIESGIRFADSDVGRHIRQVLVPPVELVDEAVAIARSQAAATLLAKKPGRQSIIRDLNAAMDNVEATVSVLINFSLGSALGASAAAPQGSHHIEPQDMVDRIEQSRPQIRAAIASFVEGHFAYLLEQISDDDLEIYLQELTTPAGRAYVEESNRAFEAALRKQAIAIGGAFARNLRSQSL